MIDTGGHAVGSIQNEVRAGQSNAEDARLRRSDEVVAYDIESDEFDAGVGGRAWRGKGVLHARRVRGVVTPPIAIIAARILIKLHEQIRAIEGEIGVISGGREAPCSIRGIAEKVLGKWVVAVRQV